MVDVRDDREIADVRGVHEGLEIVYYPCSTRPPQQREDVCPMHCGTIAMRGTATEFCGGSHASRETTAQCMGHVVAIVRVPMSQKRDMGHPGFGLLLANHSPLSTSPNGYNQVCMVPAL